MAEILSKDEIEALLSAVSTGEIDAAAKPAGLADLPKDVKVYDFLRPTPLLPRQRSILHAIHDRLCRQLSRALTAHLNLSVAIKVNGIEATSYRDFEPTLPNPSTLVVFNLDHHKTRTLLTIHPMLGFIVADRMMGGQGMPPSTPRAFTEVEQELVDEVVEIVQTEMHGAWERVSPTEISVEGRATASQFIQFVPAEEVIIALSLEVQIEEATGLIQLCYGSRILEAITQVSFDEREPAGEAGEEGATAMHVAAPGMIEGIPVPMTASMGPVPLRVREVLSLREGDVLLLNHRVGDALDLTVGGKVRYKGYLGVYHEKLTFAVSQKL